MELSLKPTSAKVKDYYNALNQFRRLYVIHFRAGMRNGPIPRLHRQTLRITNDLDEDKEYILPPIEKVIIVGVETLKIVSSLLGAKLSKITAAETPKAQ
jgi:hypothetical protein